MPGNLGHNPPFLTALTIVERALDAGDILWVRQAGGNERAFRRHRRNVIHQAVTTMRVSATLTMVSWRRSAEAQQDYGGPDPLIWMAKVRGLLWLVQILATWSITFGLPRPVGAVSVLSQLRLELEPLRSIALAHEG